MPFPQGGASKSAAGIHSPLAASGLLSTRPWLAGEGIEMIHRGTHTCNYSNSNQWAEARVPVESISPTWAFPHPSPVKKGPSSPPLRPRPILPSFPVLCSSLPLAFGRSNITMGVNLP